MMAQDTTKATRPKEVTHDETPSQITSHPFEPKGDWYTLCKECNLAESAHRDTVVQVRYYSDDVPDE